MKLGGYLGNNPNTQQILSCNQLKKLIQSKAFGGQWIIINSRRHDQLDSTRSRHVSRFTIFTLTDNNITNSSMINTIEARIEAYPSETSRPSTGSVLVISAEAAYVWTFSGQPRIHVNYKDIQFLTANHNMSNNMIYMNTNNGNINHNNELTLPTLVTKLKQHELVCGYIREETMYFPFIIPICITQLCFSFFNSIQYFKFEKETLQSFLASTNDDEWEGKQFVINQISFQFVLCVNGNTEEIEFFVRGKILSNDIHRTIVNVTFFCQETQSFFNKTFQNSSVHYDFRIGTAFMGTLSECKNRKSLTFSGEVQVLQIEYKMHIPKAIWNRPEIRMKTNINNIFEVNAHSFKKIQCKRVGKYMDNKNWILFYENSNIFLRLLRLPAGVLSVSVSCKFKMQCYNILGLVCDVEQTETNYGLTYTTNTVELRHSERYCDMSHHQSKFSKVLFECDIEICEVFKRHCVSILRKDWKKFGIID